MSTFNDLKQELKNKERSVNDLIRFVKTRTDKNPNYSFFLGAGCSITSGIRSANELIIQWKKEIFSQEKHIEEKDYKEDDAKDYYSNQMWYDTRNPYSALFEKKYDLPRQRRMFVEQEVRDKIPSIGYSYLIKLIENNFIKTLFTTNFDDLLNEAFYQYSSERPILCAHDSAISSITITSKRPKIIKLHGDYLFDDIKSTLRETESLEENIKNKFIEFAKDYGLIVIGYGGNDRSIIDILTYLLKNEEYFKHGIYWCLRSDSEINEDLRKLLWKDRVFYVKIDGFDELMAEMHSKLNEAVLPIDSNFLNEKKNKLIEQLVSNPHLKNTDCNIILNDFAKLNKTLEQDVVASFIKYLESKDENREKMQNDFIIKNNNEEKLSEEEKKILMNVRQELFTSNFNDACSLIDKNIIDIDKNRQLYIQLLESKAKCLRKLKKIKEAIVCYKELVAIDKKNITNYKALSELVKSYVDKKKYIEEAIKVDPYYSNLYYEKATILYRQFDENIDKERLSYNIDNIIEVANKCIEVNPKISNPAWYLKFDLFKEKYKDNNVICEKYNEIIESLEKQDKYFPQLVDKKVQLFNLKKEKPEIIYQYLKNCIDNSISMDYIKLNEFNLLDVYADNNNIDELKNRMQSIENIYEVDSDYLENKAKYQLKKFDNLKGSIFTLKSIKVKNDSVYNTLYEYLIYNNEFPEAEKILNNFLGGDKLKSITLLEAKKEYPKALKLIQELRKHDENSLSLCISESYLLLKTNQFPEAYNFLNKCLKPSVFTEPYLLINYFIASSKYRGKLKEEKIKEKIFNIQKHSDIIEAAAYALLKDQKNAYTKLSSVIKNDYSKKYIIKDWIVFEEIFKIDRFKKLLE